MQSLHNSALPCSIAGLLFAINSDDGALQTTECYNVRFLLLQSLLNSIAAWHQSLWTVGLSSSNASLVESCPLQLVTDLALFKGELRGEARST